MSEKNRVLVIAAHPDDEVLGAGGAIARHSECGDVISILILADGVTSRGSENKNFKKELGQRNASALSAAKILGAQTPILCGFPDNQLDTVPLLSIVKEIEKAIRVINPTIIYTHHAGDVNIDHRLVSEATEAAVRPMKGTDVKEVRAFEVASSSEWNFTRDVFRPNVFVSLSKEQFKLKCNALDEYVEEMRPFPHPRSKEYIEALAKVRGGQSGNYFAEAFELIYRRI